MVPGRLHDVFIGDGRNAIKNPMLEIMQVKHKFKR